jgi:hypothetical protein
VQDAPQPVADAEAVVEPASETVAVAESRDEPADEPKLPDVLSLSIRTNGNGRATGSHLEPDWRLFTAQGVAIDALGGNRRSADGTLLPVSRSKEENDLQLLKMAPQHAMQLLKSMTRPIGRLFGPAGQTEISEDQLSSPDLPLIPMAEKTTDTPGRPTMSQMPAD